MKLFESGILWSKVFWLIHYFYLIYIYAHFLSLLFGRMVSLCLSNNMSTLCMLPNSYIQLFIVFLIILLTSVTCFSSLIFEIWVFFSFFISLIKVSYFCGFFWESTFGFVNFSLLSLINFFSVLFCLFMGFSFFVPGLILLIAFF